MKNFFLFPAMAIAALFLSASGLPKVNQSINEKTVSTITDSIPVDLQLIFKKSCMDCHAKGGSSFAMSILNFSEWQNYTPGKQIKKASAICNEISNGAMPPKSFRKTHPDAIPTEAQIDTICKWSAALKQNKE
jgi:mono/diheme cytochrome c family protein